MANWLKAKDTNKFQIYIPRFKTDNYYAEYEIIVKSLQNIEWTVYKRYSEFDILNDKLVKVNDKYKIYFPPKKSFNNMSTAFLNSRKKSLELYLNELVNMCDQFIPRALAYFLEMDKYEIHGITTAAAKNFFAHGQLLLKKNNIFEISVLLIHAINERMYSPVPTNLYNKKDEDFGNVLDVIESLKKVKIIPNYLNIMSPDNCYGTSNIKASSLTFDLSIFTNVTYLQMNSLEISNLRGLYRMNSTIEKLQVQFSLKSIEDILFADFAYKESSIDHLQTFDGPLRCATDVDFSHNSIADIDISIVTLRQVKILNLAHNQISDIHYMQYLTFLTELDLSYNNLYMCQTQSLSNKLGSIKKLVLKGNKLYSLNIIDRMFSLEYLDVSGNLLRDNVSLLSLCRLSCLEFLFIADNPICSNSNFLVLIYDLFLDRYESVQINGQFFDDLPLFVHANFQEHRATTKVTLLVDTPQSIYQHELSSDQHGHLKKERSLNSVDILVDECDLENLNPDSILCYPHVYNIFIYWFFVSTGKYINPKKLLWVTEIFAPNRTVRPLKVLLVTSGTHSPNILKCRLHKRIDPVTKNRVITIEPKIFFDLTSDFQHMIIGADKSFIRLDISVDNRDMYLCNNSSMLDTFICHLYHVDDGMASYGDSRIVYLNEEDRMEMMRRFVDVWRLDMSSNLKRNYGNVETFMDTESELLFISRAMLQMKNGFQILLTVVVTKEIIYLVDERIYDWPDFNKHPNFSDQTSGNSCSPYTSSSSQFPFLRTNAYFLCQIEVCTEVPILSDQESLIDKLCPLFQYPVQLTFNSSYQAPKDPLKLLFENEQNINQFCRVIHQYCENNTPAIETAPINLEVTLPKLNISDLPSHLRHLQSSYTEIRLCLSLSYSKLYDLAQSPPQDVLHFYQSTVPNTLDDTIVGMVWSKFIFLNIDNDLKNIDNKERPGLICFSFSGIYVLYQAEENLESDKEYYSDPEADQPDYNNISSKLEIIQLSLSNIFKTHVGLNYQWLTICCQNLENIGSENKRLILMLRNKDLCKHAIGWINAIFADHSKHDNINTEKNKKLSKMIIEFGHQDSDIKELLYQIQKTSQCSDITFVHYCSLEDVRFDPMMSSQSINNSCNDVFSHAIVLTTASIAIIRHNVGEYPIREFAQGTIRQSPKHLQYQILNVIPLFDCLQLQLPGHDRSILIIVIKSNNSNLRYSTSFKIQLSISCQKEQKRLIEKLRQQRSKFLQIDTPLRVCVC